MAIRQADGLGNQVQSLPSASQQPLPNIKLQNSANLTELGNTALQVTARLQQKKEGQLDASALADFGVRNGAAMRVYAEQWHRDNDGNPMATPDKFINDMYSYNEQFADEYMQSTGAPSRLRESIRTRGRASLQNNIEQGVSAIITNTRERDYNNTRDGILEHVMPNNRKYASVKNLAEDEYVAQTLSTLPPSEANAILRDVSGTLILELEAQEDWGGVIKFIESSDIYGDESYNMIANAKDSWARKQGIDGANQAILYAELNGGDPNKLIMSKEEFHRVNAGFISENYDAYSTRFHAAIRSETAKRNGAKIQVKADVFELASYYRDDLKVPFPAEIYHDMNPEEKAMVDEFYTSESVIDDNIKGRVDNLVARGDYETLLAEYPDIADKISPTQTLQINTTLGNRRKAADMGIKNQVNAFNEKAKGTFNRMGLSYSPDVENRAYDMFVEYIKDGKTTANEVISDNKLATNIISALAGDVINRDRKLLPSILGDTVSNGGNLPDYFAKDGGAKLDGLVNIQDGKYVVRDDADLSFFDLDKRQVEAFNQFASENGITEGKESAKKWYVENVANVMASADDGKTLVGTLDEAVGITGYYNEKPAEQTFARSQP